MEQPNYYKLFGIPEAAEIDQPELERRYAKLQQEQISSNTSEEEKLFFMAELNEGFKNLLNPFLRAKHYLHLRGLELSQAKVEPQWLEELLEEQSSHFQEPNKAGSDSKGQGQRPEGQATHTPHQPHASHALHTERSLDLIKANRLDEAIIELAKAKYLMRYAELLKTDQH